MKKIISILIFLCTLSVSAQISYVCFQNDKNKNLFVSVKFKNYKAFGVKYGGQKSYIQLKFKKRENFQESEGRKTWWNETYNEIINGKINGQYVTTNSGTYGLDFQYYRKDGKEFYFAVYESGNDENNFPYTVNPTF